MAKGGDPTGGNGSPFAAGAGAGGQSALGPLLQKFLANPLPQGTMLAGMPASSVAAGLEGGQGLASFVTPEWQKFQEQLAAPTPAPVRTPAAPAPDVPAGPVVPEGHPGNPWFASGYPAGLRQNAIRSGNVLADPQYTRWEPWMGDGSAFDTSIPDQWKDARYYAWMRNRGGGSGDGVGGGGSGGGGGGGPSGGGEA